MKKKNFLIIHGTAPRMGGASVQTYEFIKFLNSNKENVILISPESSTPYLNEFISELRVKHIILPLNNYKYLFKNIFEIKKIIKKNKINIIYSNHRNSDIITFFSTLFNKKIKIISIIHFLNSAFKYDTSSFKFLKYHLHKFVLRFFNHIIAVSMACKNDLITYFKLDPNKIKIIYNGIDISYYNSGDKNKVNFKKIPGYIDIGYIGSISYLKNYKLLEKIIDSIIQEKIRLFLIGPNEVGNELYRLLFKYKKSNKLFYLGIQNNIPDWIKFFDFQIFVSTNESFGRSVAESMAGGCPVVAFDKGGVKEIIVNNVNGFLINDKDISEFVRIIKFLTRNQNIISEFGINAKEYIKNKFNNKKFLNSYYELSKE